MARPKTRGETKPLNVNINSDLAGRLAENCSKTGISKTTMVEKALKEYFNNHSEELELLK